MTILDQNGRLVSQDMESGGFEQPIRSSCPPARAIVQVGSQSEGALHAAIPIYLQGCRKTAPRRHLRLARRPSLLAGASSCRSGSTRCRIPIHFDHSAGHRSASALSSGDFEGSLLIEDARDNNLAESDGTYAQNAQILADLPAGTYSLGVLSIDPGSYTLTYQFTAHALATCPPPQPMDLNTGYANILGLGVCHGQDGQLADGYQFTTPSEGMLGLFMTSGDFDTYLTLTDSQGNVLRRSCRDSFGGNDSMILQWSAAGQTFNL